MPHINTLRKRRGYAWEKLIINFANSKEGYFARRLGGSSTGLPDIVITHNASGTVYAIEAKSVTSPTAYIPLDEVERCLDILKMFDYYKYKWVWFAFKFGVNKTEYQHTTTKAGYKIKMNEKKKTYFFKVTSIANLKNIHTVVCTSKGELSLIPKLNDYQNTPSIEADKYTTLNDLLVPKQKQKKLS